MTKNEFLVGDTVCHVVESAKHGDVIYIHSDGYVRVHWKDGNVGKHPAEVLRIVSDFKVGDIVQFPGNPHKRKINFISQFGGLRFDDVAGEHHPDGFVKVETEKKLKWTDVEAGDKVTFKWEDEEFTATARKDPYFMLPQIMGMATTAMHKYTIVSIEKPKPALPSTNGSIVKNLYSDKEAHLVGDTWLYAHSGVITYPDQWTKGWELVRSTAKEGKNG